MTVDYRVLLSKYMNIVGFAEGVDFIDVDETRPPTWVDNWDGPVVFTQEEWDELRNVAREGRRA